jgi:hypothetical protein
MQDYITVLWCVSGWLLRLKHTQHTGPRKRCIIHTRTHTPHLHTHCVKTRSDTHTRIDLTAVKGSFFFSLSLYYNNSIRDLFKKHKITVRRERWLRLILLFVGTLGLLDSCDNLIDLFQCWKRLNDPMGFVSSVKTEEEKLSKTATSCISRRTRLSR